MPIRSHRSAYDHPTSSEITQRSVYEGRRDLLRLMGSGVAGVALASWA